MLHYQIPSGGNYVIFCHLFDNFSWQSFIIGWITKNEIKFFSLCGQIGNHLHRIAFNNYSFLFRLRFGNIAANKLQAGLTFINKKNFFRAPAPSFQAKIPCPGEQIQNMRVNYFCTYNTKK
ncbi:hypothetical protein SDC9_140295 [bioreactor metagenome]|uniref:Uncharacterized protein n=1 Tax=bioreactor metagenome TaxID=1076179 RepID=A0A645DV31_9ZZZZ